MGWIKRSWTDEQLAEAVASSKTYRDVHRKLGLAEGSRKHVKRCIEKAGLDTSHFDSAGRAPARRLAVSDDVLIDVVKRSRTATEVLSALGLPVTGHHFNRLKRRMWQLGVTMPYFRRGPRGRRGVSWTDEQLRDAVSTCSNYASVIRQLGLIPAGGNYDAIKRRIRELALDTSHFHASIAFHGNWRRDPTPLDEVLVADSHVASHTLKLRLFAEGLKTAACELCGWAERRPLDGVIPVELDHINGDRRDNRLENLRILCPNCHSLQPTHRGLNRKRASRASEGELVWNVGARGGIRTRMPLRA
ncbi:MAG: HNH endonuclease, partial [Deltaproteobacteria bacterium]|nr:HNH endonuclease [Deltaproteobacteria bacterium]